VTTATPDPTEDIKDLDRLPLTRSSSEDALGDVEPCATTGVGSEPETETDPPSDTDPPPATEPSPETEL